MLNGLRAAVQDQAARDGIVHLPSLDWLVSGLGASEADRKVVEVLIDRLGRAEWQIQLPLSTALSYVPEQVWAEHLVAALIDQLDHAHSSAALTAGRVLAKTPDAAWTRPLVAALVDRLDRADQGAIRAISRAPGTVWTKDIVRALVALFDHADAAVQVAGIGALRNAPGTVWTKDLVATLVAQLGHADEASRISAAYVLAETPDAVWSDALTNALLAWLDDPRLYSGRAAAIAALSRAPEWVWSDMLADALVVRLGDAEGRVRAGATWLLTRAPHAVWSDHIVDALVTRLGDSEREARGAALEALSRAPESIVTEAVWANVLAGAIVTRLGDAEATVRILAARALGRAPKGVWTEEMANALVDRLGDPEESVRGAAVEAFRRAPRAVWTGALIDLLVRRLGNDDQRVRQPDPWVREGAIRALAVAPAVMWTEALTGPLAARLGDLEQQVRNAAVDALNGAPEEAWTEALAVTIYHKLLDDQGPVSDAAARALAGAPSSMWADEMVATLITQLGDPARPTREATALALSHAPPNQITGAVTIAFIDASRSAGVPPLVALRQAPPASVDELLPLLHQLEEGDRAQVPPRRALMHIVSGGSEEASELLRWLGQPAVRPFETVTNHPDEAHRLLMRLHGLLGAIPDRRPLAAEAHRAAGAIAEAACRRVRPVALSLADAIDLALRWLWRLPREGPLQPCWTDEQTRDIEVVAAWIAPMDPAGARLIEQQLEHSKAAPLWRNITWSVAGWFLFWLLFIVAYPWSRNVQAVFLFNKWIRRLLSLGAVPLLLLVVPPLRRCLMAPFKGDLLAEARLDELERLRFFGLVRARRGDEPPRLVQDVLMEHNGLVVLCGEAGLGKTSALRWLASRSRCPIAYLHARDCDKGVAEAIVRLMKGVQDTDFVRAMVHAGTLSAIVDGFNEVSAGTRECIRSFAADNRKGRVLIATQPIQWTPPAHAKVIELLPLSRQETEAFLLSRPVGADASQPVHGAAYEQAVHTFLRRALDEAPSEPERKAAAEVLSNPFDLAFAADLIAQGEVPSASGLIEEAFRLASEGPGNESYRAVTGQPFPLVAFGRHAVTMRTDDRNWLKPDEFEAERPCLLARKLLVRRAVRGSDDTTEDREMFRHDRVWDFFIAAAFREDPALLEAHLDDPRFRSAYLQIAEKWPPEVAKTVRDLLVVHAAHSNDNSLTNEFVRRLEARLEALRRMIAELTDDQPADP